MRHRQSCSRQQAWSRESCGVSLLRGGEEMGTGTLTFTGLLPTLQAVARGAHAGSGGLGSGETELRAVTII